jgi:hypothetical protein
VGGYLGRPVTGPGRRGLAGRRRGPARLLQSGPADDQRAGGYAGTDRWILTGALFLTGGCHLVTAAGLARVRPAARVLLVIAGLASIGMVASPEPVRGSVPQHLAWTALGAVTLTVWPAFTGRRSPARPLILSAGGAADVTAVFAGLLVWLVIETQGGSAPWVWPSACSCWSRTPGRSSLLWPSGARTDRMPSSPLFWLRIPAVHLTGGKHVVYRTASKSVFEGLGGGRRARLGWLRGPAALRDRALDPGLSRTGSRFTSP